MVSTTLSFRIAPPLYGLHTATLSLRDVAGLDEVTVTVTLVDSGAPTNVQVVTSGSGSVTMPGDNLGILHNTRLDVIVLGAVSDWMRQDTGVALARIANRLIDWYRFAADQPFVRRIPLGSVGGFDSRDD